MNTRSTLFAVLFLLLSATAPARADDAAKLGAIIDEYTQATKRLDPYAATYFNVEEDLDKFGDYLSPEWLARGKKIVVTAVEKLKTVDPATLPPKDRRTYELFKGDVTLALEGYDFPTELLDFNQMDNRFRSYIDDSSKDLTSFPFDSVKHYDAWVKRSEGFPAFVDTQIATLKRGVKEGVVLSCVTAKKALNTYKDGLEPTVEKNPFWRPVEFMPKDFVKADRERIEKGIRAMITERILPGLKKFDAYYRTEYLPHCRKSYGMGGIPNGKKWYEYAVKAGTNLDLNPQQLHETGLKEVARIGKGIDEVRKELGFKGTREEFLKSLNGDKTHYFKSAKEMFEAFKAVKARMTPIIPKYFSLIPKSDYTIVESGNPEDAAGSYHDPTEMQPIGRFVINTHNLQAVADYDVTSLSLHEAIPGHHFQLALQFEMKDQLSEYQRKVFGSNAFVEGWALYSEYLGNEMGAYKDPWQRLGNLTAEMLRAVRLVVDTGIHSMDWSREKTIAYMKANLVGDAKDIETEADRYSVWPGQALGYKVGQLKILELRHKAEAALGPKFDIRDFHRVVIGNGTVSLPVLEEQVDAWIESQKPTRG